MTLNTASPLCLFLMLCSSGGKDSCYNMMQCVAAGHRIVALANLRPALTGEEDEMLGFLVGIHRGWAELFGPASCTSADPGNSRVVLYQ